MLSTFSGVFTIYIVLMVFFSLNNLKTLSKIKREEMFFFFLNPMARHVIGKPLALGVADIDGQLVKGHPVGEPSLPQTGQHKGTFKPHPGPWLGKQTRYPLAHRAAC